MGLVVCMRVSYSVCGFIEDPVGACLQFPCIINQACQANVNVNNDDVTRGVMLLSLLSLISFVYRNSNFFIFMVYFGCSQSR